MVRHRCGVLNSLRAKHKNAVTLKYNTVFQTQECYMKSNEKRQTPKEILLTDYSSLQQDNYQSQQTGSCKQHRIQKALKKWA